jgi:prepilin-type N-terminal cleavage/methylation domain-containing protein
LSERIIIRRNTGFTLIEVMIVCAVIGILAMMSVPTLQGIIERYRLRAASMEFTGLFNRMRAASVHAPTASGSTPYQISIDCGNESFSVTPALPGTGKSSYSAASDFAGVNVYAVESNLNNAPAAEQTGIVTRGIDRSGSTTMDSGTRNFTVFFATPNGLRYRVQVYGTIGRAQIISEW